MAELRARRKSPRMLDVESLRQRPRPDVVRGQGRVSQLPSRSEQRLSLRSRPDRHRIAPAASSHGHGQLFAPAVPGHRARRACPRGTDAFSSIRVPYSSAEPHGRLITSTGETVTARSTRIRVQPAGNRYERNGCGRFRKPSCASSPSSRRPRCPRIETSSVLRNGRRHQYSE